ncbi:MAG: tRNA (adenosine(37)-N6)-dimethylallyltransferase MiaA [Armatimonadetes bacterium]|nr:tRNA (adenosine(37)-N6)-dimethylallyltransferase MiaA [Armatimonadota bacterium]
MQAETPGRDPLLIAILGPTGSGKTAFAERLADEIGAQLINADAFQVYRGFTIGTAKPRRVREYELIDILDPSESFGVGDWVRRSSEVLRRLHAENRSAVFVGGTGFYIRALFERYEEMSPEPEESVRQGLMEREKSDGLAALVEELRQKAPQIASQIDLRNPVRVRRALEKLATPAEKLDVKYPTFRSLKVGISPTVSELDRILAVRCDTMIAEGWIEEVRAILATGLSMGAPAWRAIGYYTLVELIEGRIELDEARKQIILLTRQYAKRQRTWLRSEPNLEIVNLSGFSEAEVEGAWSEIQGHVSRLIE